MNRGRCMLQRPRVVTVTLNPAIDQSVFVDELRPGAVHRVTRSQRQAGGKGVNVATMLALGGCRVTVTGFLGADNVSLFESHFERHGMEDRFVRIPGETRVGIKILDTVAGTTDLNFPGADPDGAALDELRDRLKQLCRKGTWFVFAGSLPLAADVPHFIELVNELRAAGALVAVDSSGAALSAAIEAGVDLIKPNEQELAEALQLPDARLETVMAAVEGLSAQGMRHVILSMGKDGALFESGGQRLRAYAPELEVVSTVGAGDALLAGYLEGLMRGLDLEGRVRLAMVFAWSRLQSLEPQLPEPEAIEERMALVRVERG